MSYIKILEEHSKLNKRNKNTLDKYLEVKIQFNNIDNDNIFIYTVGSIGRDEIGTKSDLDLFYISKEDIGKLEEHKIFAESIKINENFGFEPFSNDGQFLKVHNLENMKNTIGDPKDDEENLFTARMLLLLESKVLNNERLYYKSVEEIIEIYFRDYKVGMDFNPLFLLNDLLRFWRTLCLNYENTRHKKENKYRKKNLNLKYSRMITVYGTILYIITKENLKKEDLVEISKYSPLKRFAIGLDSLGQEKYETKFMEFLDLYENFLEAKENGDIETNEGLKDKLDLDAIKFSDFIYNVLVDENIKKEYRKYLVV